jgi:DNA-binding PadR family transcriptional regulator
MAAGTSLSATEAALLALLTRGEMSGYDLQRAAERAAGFFWAPTKSRIYAVLPQLVERGFATSREVQQTGRPNKQLYRISKSGRAAVQAWLEEPPAFEPERAPILLKLYFGELVSPQILLSHVQHIRQEAAELQERLQAQPDDRDVYAELAFKHTLEWLKTLGRWATAAEHELRNGGPAAVSDLPKR